MLDPAGIPQAVLSSPPALGHLATYLPGQGHVVDEEMVDAVMRVLHRYSRSATTVPRSTGRCACISWCSALPART